MEMGKVILQPNNTDAMLRILENNMRNGLNDLVIAFESETSKLVEKIDNEFDSTYSTQIIILILAFILTATYWILSVNILIRLQKEFSQFMNVLFMSNHTMTSLVHVNLQSFQNILKNNLDDYEIIRQTIFLKEQ